MKKVLIGALQFISYVIIYEVVVWVIYLLASLLQIALNRIPALKIIIPDIAMEGIVFTICPAICGLLIVSIMGILYKRTGLYLISTILMFMVLSYTNISNIVATAVDYGIISWNFANVVWQSVILCGIVIVGLLGLSGYGVLKMKDK